MKLIGERPKRTIRVRVQLVLPLYASRQPKHLTITFHPNAAVFSMPALDGPRGHSIQLGEDEDACVLRFESAPSERVFLHLLVGIDDPGEDGSESAPGVSRIIGFKNHTIQPGHSDLTLTLNIDNFELYSLYESAANDF